MEIERSDKKIGFFNRLLRPFMAVGSTAVVAQVLVMLQNMILARWLGPELNAYVIAGFNVASLGFILVNWGFDHWLLQQSSLEPKNSQRHLNTVLSTKLIFGCLVCIVLLILLPLIRGDVYIPLILGIALLDILTESLNASAYMYLHATDRYKRSSITLTIARILRLASTLLLIVLKVKAIPWFVGLRFLIDFGILAYLWLLLKPKIQLTGFTVLKSAFRKTWAFGLAEILNMAYDHLDVTLLAFLTLDKAEISYYGIAINVLIAGLGILQSLHYVLVPYIIKQEKTETPIGTRKLYAQPLMLILSVGIIGMILLFFFSQNILNLMLGGAYIETGRLVKLASPLIALKSVSVALSSFLIARQSQILKLLPLTIVTFLKTMLIVIFYPKYGLNGMMVIFMLCELILILLYTIQLLRTRGKKQSVPLLEDQGAAA